MINRIDITNAVDNINISINDIESSISYLKETVDTLINNSNKRFEEDEIVLKSVEQKNINLLRELCGRKLKVAIFINDFNTGKSTLDVLKLEELLKINKL